MQILRKGSVGADVLRVQRTLNAVMLPPVNRFTTPAMKALVEDGRFGPKTEAMVREYQRLNQIMTDGVVGPITSYFIFPYITFTSSFSGQGLTSARLGGLAPVPNRGTAVGFNLPPRGPRFGLNPTPTPQTPGAGGKTTPTPPPESEDGLTFELSVGAGAKHAFAPWFVLKPNDDPQGAESEGSFSVGATILRHKGFEFGGEFEFSRPLFASSGDSSWQWEGALKGSYTNFKNGRFGLSPIVDLSVKQGLNLGLGVGAEASVELISERLELKVGGKFAMDIDPRIGTTTGGFELGAGLELKFDVTRLAEKKK